MLSKERNWEHFYVKNYGTSCAAFIAENITYLTSIDVNIEILFATGFALH